MLSKKILNCKKDFSKVSNKSTKQFARINKFVLLRKTSLVGLERKLAAGQGEFLIYVQA